ncbi:MAG: hypothetical protein QNK03_20910 [Myxococcota bacterium]|nr:hypothetical protein [Myxococcota bacterium]
MDAARGVGMAAFVLVSLVAGARLMGLWWRTRQSPELSIGLNLLLGGAAFPLLFASMERADQLGSAVGLVRGSGLLCLNLGAAALWYFTWRVFRSHSRVVLGVALVAAFLLLASHAAIGLGSGFAGDFYHGFWFWSGYLSRLLAFGWAAFESLRYAVAVRRRVRLGLAEPLLVHRFALWGVAAGSATGIFGLRLAELLMGKAGAFFGPTLTLVASALGLCASASIWFAFFPPEAYRRRVGTET